MVQPAPSVLDTIFLIVGGLGLFLFGMRVMSDALKRAAGDKMRSILRVMTGNIFKSVLAGTAVTCIIQSSSATTVMVVGFVNAGLLTLTQAIGVIMGANIGTTITAWLVSAMEVAKYFKYANVTYYALPSIGIGFALSMLGRRQWKHWGTGLLGFGLLFFGLTLMKDAFGPLQNSEKARQIVGVLAGNPFMGLLVGTLMTILIQSSSATIAIAQLLASQGVLTFPQAVPIIFGDNIGTTTTALIASVGTNVSARRAACAHLMFNVLGVIILMPFVYFGLYARFINAILGPATQGNVMSHMAASHTLFNVTNTCIFMPLAGLLAAIVTRLVPGAADTVKAEPQYLEEHLLATPSIALEQARKEVVRMLELARSAVCDASDAFFRKDLRALALVAQKEAATDNLQDKITRYLTKVSMRQLTPEEANQLPVFLHAVNDIERIGDHAVNLKEAAERRIDDNLHFTAPAMEELGMMWAEAQTMFDTTLHALEFLDRDAAVAVCTGEEKLNAMEREFRESHLRRLYAGECNFYSGLTFVDCIYNYEKIGDHLTNVAQAVLGDFQWGEREKDSEHATAPGPAAFHPGAAKAGPARVATQPQGSPPPVSPPA